RTTEQRRAFPARYLKQRTSASELRRGASRGAWIQPRSAQTRQEKTLHRLLQSERRRAWQLDVGTAAACPTARYGRERIVKLTEVGCISRAASPPVSTLAPPLSSLQFCDDRTSTQKPPVPVTLVGKN